jgi:hypothetical protein
MTLPHRGYLLFSLLCAALAILPFLPGLPGSFVFDDEQNIVQNSAIELQSLEPGALLYAALSPQPGGMTRVLPTLTFALDYWRGNGFDPATFKITNIAIHAVTTFVLAWFLRSLLLIAGVTLSRARWSALAMALAWALHPLQVSSVLYVVQRMQTLATLFVVLALWAYLVARQAQMEGQSGRRGWMLAGLLGVVAVSCKEDAVLLPVYMLALELTVLRFRASDPGLSRNLHRGYMLLTALAAAAYVCMVVPHYWAMDTYTFRNFSTLERLLSEGRVLCMYLWEILLPLPSHLPFYYDWVQPSRGLLQPWTTLPAYVLLLALLGAAWHMRKQRPLFALGVLLFLAGHLVTANVVPLELAFEHRNHFPLIGIVLAVGDALALAVMRLKLAVAARVAGCLLVLVTLASATAVRARSWDSDMNLALTSTQLAPGSARAWNSLCVIYFIRGGGPKFDNLNIDKAVAACSEGAKVADDSVISLTNIIAYKGIQGTLTEADWDRYLTQLRRVKMTLENRSSIWVILNQVRRGVHMDESRVLETIDVVNRRAPFKPIESAAIGYFILEHTRQAERATPFFIRAMKDAADPSFSDDIIIDLRKQGHAHMADKLQADFSGPPVASTPLIQRR